MQEVITVQGLSKQFRRYHQDRPMTFQEAFLRGLRRLAPAERFWALRDINFSIAPGRMVGVIGSNGAGKSTLLRLIGGVGRPDRGRVNVRGRIGALLDLGTDFHPDLTGRENVYVSGVIAGLTRREVEDRFDSIVSFAGLEEFIDNQLRTYSTGMRMRLAFAVAAHIEPDILLVDEVLAVGDIAFQQKCLGRIAQFKAEGCTIFLVSHDASSVRQLCDEVIWLREGQLVAHGPAEVVVDQYVAEMTAGTNRPVPPTQSIRPTTPAGELRLNETRFGTLEMQIVGVHLLDAAGLPATELAPGDPLQVEIEYLAPQAVESPIFSAAISCEDGFVCYDTNTNAAGLVLPTVQGRGRVVLKLERLDLNGGSYYVDVGAYECQWARMYDYHWHVYPLNVRPVGEEKGVLRLPHRWEIGAVEPARAGQPECFIAQ